MSELVEKLAEQYGWSPSVPNHSDKLRRESLRYKGAVELAGIRNMSGYIRKMCIDGYFITLQIPELTECAIPPTM